MKKTKKSIYISLLFALLLLTILILLISGCSMVSAPTNLSVERSSLNWRSGGNVWSNRVYVRRAGSDEFVFVREVAAEGHGHCCEVTDAISLRELNLKIGENIVRVVSLGNFRWNGNDYLYNRSSGSTIRIVIDNIIEEQVSPFVVSDFFELSILGNEVIVSGNAIMYFRHPNKEEFVRVDGFMDHGAFFGTLPELRLGESTLKLIRHGAMAELDGTILTVFTNSEPVFMSININDFEVREVSAPTNLRVVGSGTPARLQWDTASDVMHSAVSVRPAKEEEFIYNTNTFNNSIQLNSLGWIEMLVLGDNDIKVITHGRGTFLDGDILVSYKPGYAIYTLTIHREQAVATPNNFRIEVIHGILSLTWDSDSITDGNSITNLWTLIEVKNPGQEKFRDAGIGGVVSGINISNSWLFSWRKCCACTHCYR